MESIRELEIVKGHQIIRLPEGTALLDTGSPADIGRGLGFEVLGSVWCPTPLQAGVLDIASVHLGTDIDWLLGAPFLSSHRTTIDPHRGRVTFSDDDLDVSASHAVPIQLESGVPRIEISVHRNGEVKSAVLDSGAPLSYAPAADVADLAQVRIADDFHPSIGMYRTPVYEVLISIGRRAMKVEVGNLPPSLKAAFGDIWIVGGDFFRDRVITLDYSAGRIIDS